ncbi:hypothetical protein NMY22_g13020 [Coprinellus aureogranulatus]|nr:hypothetical protein NMY22_g13020 [Coprinellus aureogranulatus]
MARALINPLQFLPEDVFLEVCGWIAVGRGAWGSKGDYCNIALSCQHAKSMTIEDHPAKSQGFFATSVKAIQVSLVPNDVDCIQRIRRILSACTGLQEFDNSVFAWSLNDTLHEKAQHLINCVPALERFVTSIEAFHSTQRGFGHPVFRNVTHLQLSYEPRESQSWNWDSLGSLTRLTHLSIKPTARSVVGITQNIIATLCKASSTLRLLLVDKHYRFFADFVQEVIPYTGVDVRVVVYYQFDLCEPYQWVWKQVDHYALAFKREYYEDPDLLWKAGDMKVTARRTGLVELAPKFIE